MVTNCSESFAAKEEFDRPPLASFARISRQSGSADSKILGNTKGTHTGCPMDTQKHPHEIRTDELVLKNNFPEH